MKGDFSRRFGGSSAGDNYGGVLYQQGRVFLDADGNDELAILTEWQDTAGADVIGDGVAAAPASHPDSLRVEAANLAGGVVTLTVASGHAWADGVLVRVEGTPPIHRVATYLQPPVQDPPADTATIANGVRDAVVLEVWRDVVNGFQLPDELIEPALGGPDTTERLLTACDFRLLRLVPGDTCENIGPKLDDRLADRGELTVTLQPTTVIPGDCPVVQGGGYTGFEHNLFRIEIAETNAAAAMFKWSQWNGGLVGRGLFDAVTRRVTLTANLQAIITSGLSDFYLETREFDASQGRWRTTYGAAVTLNNDNQLELPPVATFGTIPAGAAPVFFRLWNDIRAITDFPVGPTPTELIDGIRLEFAITATIRYVPEDFWTFSVRAGEIANPQTLINAEPPQGIRYHRVPLGILEWDGSPDLSLAEGTIEDCRHVFPPLTRLATCCTYRVGDGVESHGDFTSIQAAIDHLPPRGGEVCVLPGTYTENVLVDRRANITIHGCGQRSRVVSRPPATELGTADPVIHVRDSRNIRITGLAVEAHETGIGILLEGQTPSYYRIATRDVTLAELWIVAGRRCAIEAHSVREVTICKCRISMRDLASPWPGIFFQGDDSLIERNDIRVENPRQIEIRGIEPIAAAAGLGGMQIGGGSERVRILDNFIQRGIGNGITLGSVRIVDARGRDIGGPVGWVVNADDPCNPCLPGDTGVPPDRGDDGGQRTISAGALYDIRIAFNRIFDMGLNGIGVIGFFDLSGADEMISVERLTILDNIIKRCLRRTLAPISTARQDSIGYGAIALADVSELVIHDNVLQNNGFSDLDPVCGIFVLHGEGIDICRNRILNNGAKSGEGATQARAGRRGGINVVYCVPPTTPIRILQEVGLPDQNGVPALRVHDNIVSAPLGQALMATALGPVSVQGNQFTTRGVVVRSPTFSSTLIAATVLILDLGLSNELYLQVLAFNAMRAGNLATNKLAAVDNDRITTPSRGIDDLRLGRYLANGNVLFANNQCMLDLLESGFGLSLSSILIITLDDIGFHGNQCDCNLFDDVVLSQAILAAPSLRVSDNRFKEGRFNAVFSAMSLGVMNTTAGNQATHCLFIRPLPPNPLLVNGPNTELFGPLGTSVEICGRFSGELPNYGTVVKG
jgi:hypothetical protein